MATLIKVWLIMLIHMAACDDIDPSLLQRHIYTLEDFCEELPRIVHFHEQLIVRSQRYGKVAYQTNVTCAMGMKGTQVVDGFVIALRTVSTLDASDNVTLMVQNGMTKSFFGLLFSQDSAENSFFIDNKPFEVVWRTAPAVLDSRNGLGFELTVTPFSNECHEGTECFRCANDRLIHAHFACNERNNCGDLSDEASCGPVRRIRTALIVCIVLLSSVLLVLTQWFLSRRAPASPESSHLEQLPAEDFDDPPLNDGERTPLFASSTRLAHGNVLSIVNSLMDSGNQPSISRAERSRFGRTIDEANSSTETVALQKSESPV